MCLRDEAMAMAHGFALADKKSDLAKCDAAHPSLKGFLNGVIYMSTLGHPRKIGHLKTYDLFADENDIQFKYLNVVSVV